MTDQWLDYQQGGADSKGRRIDKIFSHMETHVIYEAEGKLQVEGEIGRLHSADGVNMLLASILAFTPTNEPAKTVHHTQLSQALNSCFSGEVESCISQLKAIHARMINRRSASARLVFLWSSVAACVCMWSLYLLAYTQLSDAASGTLLQLSWILILAVGATGGAFSVAIRQKDLPVDPDRRKLMHCANGVSRIVLAMLAAVACYLALKAGVILDFAGNSENSYLLYFFIYLAGFSETFIPNVLSNTENGG